MRCKLWQGIPPLLLGLATLFLVDRSRADEPGNFEVHEWSVWAVAPNESDWNAADKYPSALPGVVSSSRLPSASRGEDVLAPVSVLTFHGQPTKEVDVGLRAQIARFVTHWPKGTQSEKRIRWQGLEFVSDLADKTQLAYVSPDHWFGKARELDGLFVRLGARSERFLAYDPVIHATVPLEVAGGPDKFQLSNAGKFPLHDVLISAPVAEGRRVGWLDTLPAAKVEETVPDKPVELALSKDFRGSGVALRALAFMPGGARLAAAGDDGMIRMWDVGSGQLQMTLEGHQGPVRVLGFANDTRLFSGGDDKQLRVWDAATGKPERSVDKHAAPITALVIAPNSAQALTGDKEGKGYRWNIANMEPIRKPISLHRGEVLSASICPNENFVVTGGDDRIAKIWRPRSFPSPAGGSLKGHHDQVTAVSCGPDNQTVATGSLDTTVRIWNLAQREEQAKLEIGGRVRAIAYIPGTSRVVVGTEEPDKLSIWDVAAKKMVARINGQKGAVNALALSSDGRTLATGGADGTVAVWDISQDALAAAGGQKTAGPSVELALSAPLSADSPQLRAETIESLSKRLTAAGLTAKEAELLVSIYAKTFFESKELVALCRLSPDSIEDLLALDIYPEPKKIRRVALVLIRKIDPRSKVEVAELVKQLGDASYEKREAAEKRLADLGSVAIPALRSALRETDLEIVFRAERLLAGQNQAGAGPGQ